jgi:glycosyltransferase involved in cell wall biosynthesis
MKVMKLVSLIMPVWRPQRDWLVEAVESALAQRECLLELVIVDDGCEPPVQDLLDIRDQRLRFVRIAHAGQGAALNAGIAAARGEWLRFVDADDVLTPGSTRHLAELMDGDRIVAYGSTMVCDEHLAPQSAIGSSLQGDVVADCLLGRFSTRHPSMLFSRRTVEAAGPWDTTFRVSADWDFALRALEHAEARGDGEIATLYRRHGRSVSRTADVAAGEESRRRMITKYFERHPDQRGSALERDAWSALYVERGRAYWDAHQYRASVDRFARAIRVEPVTGARELAQFLGRRVRRRLARAATASVV